MNRLFIATSEESLVNQPTQRRNDDKYDDDEYLCSLLPNDSLRTIAVKPLRKY